MISSKLLPFARVAFKNGFKTGVSGQRLISTSATKMGHAPYTYRSFPVPPKKYEIMAEAAGAFFWWWVFWHLFTDYGHLVGEFDFPCIEEWTDAELGIPPDDADDP